MNEDKEILFLTILAILTIMCVLHYNKLDKRIKMVEECTKSCLVEEWANK